MKSLQVAGFLAVSLSLSACSSSYSCSSGDVIEVLGQKAEEYISKADENFQKNWRSHPAESVSFEFNAIRMLAHDKSTGTYQCSATMKTSTEDGQKWEGELEYKVFLVDDPNSDFQVEYNSNRLASLMWSALSARDSKLSEPMRLEIKKAALLKQLNYYRDAGDWLQEKAYADALTNLGLEVPQRTPAQQIMFGPPPTDFYGKPMEVPGGELEQTPELLALQAKKLEGDERNKDEAARVEGTETAAEEARVGASQAENRALEQQRQAVEEKRRQEEDAKDAAAEAALRAAKGYGGSTQQD